VKTAALVLLLAFASCSKVNPPPAPESSAMAAGAGGEKASEHRATVWSVRDNGKRCIVAPCPSWTATNAATGESREITGVDLSALDLEGDEVQKTRERILAGKAKARGEIKTVPAAGPAGDGTVLFVIAVE